MELLFFPVIIFFIAIAALSVLLHFVPIGLWISALAADVNISLFNLVGMRIRRVSPQMIGTSPQREPARSALPGGRQCG